MPDEQQTWKTILLKFAHDVEQTFDEYWRRIERRLDRDPLMIQPYLGHGSDGRIHLRGRVMQDNGLIPSDKRDTIWENLLNTYRRFATDEIAFAVVKARHQGQETTVTADEEGFFKLEIPHTAEPSNGEGRAEIHLEVTAIPDINDTERFPQATAHAVIPSTRAEFGIISDLDDTVIQSDVLNLIKLARNTFLQNAHKRLPFEGVAAFYRALWQGQTQAENPIYYVSSSPWNLYDLLTDFLELKRIPNGPLFLQDIGLTDSQFLTKSHGEHKLQAIREILHTNASLPFVLIGDSSQHDPEIYTEVAREHAGRIRAIYIRDVTRSDARTAEVKRLAETLRDHNVPVRLVADTAQAAEHAREIGLITEGALEEVIRESEHDKAEPSTIEQLIESTT